MTISVRTPLDPQPQHRLRLRCIVDATALIDPVFLDSPQYRCEALSEALGCDLTLKLETCNPIRCFKGRGADYFVACATARGDTRPMVCASAGNFGQALAYASSISESWPMQRQESAG